MAAPIFNTRLTIIWTSLNWHEQWEFSTKTRPGLRTTLSPSSTKSHVSIIALFCSNSAHSFFVIGFYIIFRFCSLYSEWVVSGECGHAVVRLWYFHSERFPGKQSHQWTRQRAGHDPIFYGQLLCQWKCLKWWYWRGHCVSIFHMCKDDF